MAKYKVYSKSKLFKIAPKWRWILLILISSLSFMIDDWRFYVANLAITLTLGCLTNVPYSHLCKPIRSCFYLLVMVFVMHTICRDWVYGIHVILRFCNIALFASCAFYPISHLDSIEGLEALLKPMSFIGFNPAKVSLSLALAMRFVPLIIDTLQEVAMAQKAKGIHKHFMAMLVPSIIKTIKMAEDIAEAIEARSWE